MKEILQLAADADTRKDALLQEVRVSAREQQAKVDKEREKLMQEREVFEGQKREQREKDIQIRAKMEELEYQKRES